MPSRYINTDDIGVALLNLCISENLGWICRNTSHSDVGIDATIEQVIDGNPTAKFISVQLKTGMGNVYIDNNNNFTYYIDNTHYEYWLSSSIPVILAICDPNKKIIYWELIKKHNISRTNKQFKITIPQTHQLNKNSLSELNTIIDTYQSDFVLPDFDNEDLTDIHYWEELLNNCAETLSNSRITINQLDEKYKNHNESMTKFIDQNKNGIDKAKVKREVSRHAKAFSLALNICKTNLRNHIPIIAKTHIESIRLAECAFNKINPLPNVISNYLQEELQNEIVTIENLISTLKIGVEKYSNNSSPTYELRESEHSFAIVLKEYIAELECIVFGVKKLFDTLNMH